jgi:hypothetical protein
VEVEISGDRRTATVQELITFLKWVFTNGSDDVLLSTDIAKGSAAPLPCFLYIKCDESTGWLTFDTDTLKPKVRGEVRRDICLSAFILFSHVRYSRVLGLQWTCKSSEAFCSAAGMC